jgi:glycosyltransferase involved in cell wall biosynthesis
MDYLVTVNEEGREEFHALGYPLERLKSIPNGVAFPSDGKVQYDRVFFGITTVRLDRQKGIDILLRAWTRVVNHKKSLNLFIIGKGPHEREFKDLCESLGISDSVKFLGEVIQVEEYLKKSDMFVLASRAEGMSNALLEAMSRGIPCIATNISGNVELIAEKTRIEIHPGEFVVAQNGILVNPEDVEALSRAIGFLVGDRKTRESLGKSARECVRNNYSIELIADKYIELYCHLLQRDKKCAGFAAS